MTKSQFAMNLDGIVWFKSMFFSLANGFYVFVNTRGYPSSRATLTSPTIPFNGTRAKKCLMFSYHMHGASVNYLDVHFSTVGNRRSIWSRRGTQGDRWIYAEVQLDITKKTQVSKFFGVSGRFFA